MVTGSHGRTAARMFGPADLVAVGYMDPGNRAAAAVLFGCSAPLISTLTGSWSMPIRT